MSALTGLNNKENGEHFLPISHRICSGSKTPNAKSNATKYKKIPKSERIAPDSAGVVEREQLDQTKLILRIMTVQKCQSVPMRIVYSDCSTHLPQKN